MPCPGTRPSVSRSQMSDILMQNYGVLLADMMEYSGYDDYSAYVTSADGQRFVLKTLGTTNSGRLVYQSALGSILNSLHAHGIPVPRIINPIKQSTSDSYVPTHIQLNEHGDKCSGHLVHLLTYIPGIPLDSFCAQTSHSIPHGLIRDIGQLLAKFHRCASSLTSVKPSEFEPVELGWEQHACIQVLDVLPLVEFSEKRSNRVREAIINFDEHYKSNKGRLASGLLHGDMIACNIIINVEHPNPPSLQGLIDFGEICYSAIVHDLAQLIASLVNLCQNELDEMESQISCLLHGYISYADCLPLTITDIDHLYLSVHARFAQMQTLCRHDANLDPRSSEYILSDYEERWDAWDKFSLLDQDSLVSQWKFIVHQ